MITQKKIGHLPLISMPVSSMSLAETLLALVIIVNTASDLIISIFISFWEVNHIKKNIKHRHNPFIPLSFHLNNNDNVNDG